MAVLQMQYINIYALKKDRKAILERLQTLGVIEIRTTFEDKIRFEKMETDGPRATFEKQVLIAEQALEVLQKYVPEKTSLLSGLEGKKRLEGDIYAEISEEYENYVAIANRLVNADKQIAQCKADIIKLENRIAALTPWLALDVATNTRGTRKTTLIIGTMPGALELAGIYALLAEQAPQIDAIDVTIISSSKDFVNIAVICLKNEADHVEDVLRSSGFARPSGLGKNIPAGKKAALEKRIDGLRREISQLESMIADQAGSREMLRIVSDYYRVRADKYEVLGQIPQTRKTFMVSGFVPQKDAKALVAEFQGQYNAAVEIEDVQDEDDVPVLLQNNRFSASSEGILAAFGLPAKGDIDPTAIMSIFYVLLFGLMLSDAAYGLIVSLACGFVLLKFPRIGQSMKKSMQLFFWCGISTVFWGVMFGGYFGDAIAVVARTFFGREITVPAVWFVPLDDPMKMLIYSLLFGVIHLFTGLALKGYICIKDKKYLDFFCDVILWFLLLVGLLILLLPSELFVSISQMNIVFPAFVNALGKVFSIVGAAGILLMSGRGTKNFGLRIALGAYDLYNITGWLSDILSYSRLLALGLATGVIASVINQMGSMMGGSVLGAIVFILVFLAGHVLNLGINLLGAYVHTCRLQYVEFFGKFYEGSGRAFMPFKTNTKYVDIEEKLNL